MVDNGTPSEHDDPSAETETSNSAAGESPAPRSSSPQLNVAGQNIAPPTAEKKWYIVNTYSGHENKAKLTLQERIKNNGLD